MRYKLASCWLLNQYSGKDVQQMKENFYITHQQRKFRYEWSCVQIFDSTKMSSNKEIQKRAFGINHMLAAPIIWISFLTLV